MKSMSRFLAPLAALVCGCAPPPANLEFSDAAALVFREFDNEEPAHVARGLRELEREIYLSMDVDAASPVARALSPDQLEAEDVAGVEHPDIPLDRNIPVAVSAASKYDVGPLSELPLLDDQLPFEPGSPDHYDRTFVEGKDCWGDRSCEFLITSNLLTKQNAALRAGITYTLPKEYRWVDMNLPDPGGEGDPLVVNEGEERWAIAARTWTTQREANDEGDSIEQSYTVELWVPRDGGGFVRDGEENVGGGTWTGDSTGGGTLRMMGIWSQSIIVSIAADDETIAAVTRTGIDDIFETVETWMDENRPL